MQVYMVFNILGLDIIDLCLFVFLQWPFLLYRCFQRLFLFYGRAVFLLMDVILFPEESLLNICCL